MSHHTGYVDRDYIEPHYDAELVARATALVPLIREHAAEASENRRVSPVVMEALEEAELLNLFVPERFGGHGATMRTSMEVLAEIARGDGSTGWAASLLNVCTWFATTYSAEAQDAVFGANPKAKVSGIFTPPSRMERVEGGYRVSGRWPYASGSFAADWATLGIALDVPEGEDPRALALFSKEQFTIEPTWFVTGMKGTGSDTIVIDDEFVPDSRIQSFKKMCEAEYATPFTDQERNPNMSFIPVAALVLISPHIGLARHALEIVREKLPNKSVAYTRYTEARNSPTHQLGVSRAATTFRLAELLAGNAADLIDHYAFLGRLPDLETRAQIRNDTGVVHELVNDGINTLLTANGAGSFAEANVLSRIWRDTEIAGRHSLVSTELGREVYGQVLLGTDDSLILDL
jgi:alkylation response protein AidB-like acyl-CoA dehydrogenase